TGGSLDGPCGWGQPRRKKTATTSSPFGRRTIMPVSIAIADDHPLARRGLRQYLEAEGDLRVVVDASSGEELLVAVERADPEPDVALIDSRMPGMDGAEAARRVHRRFPAIRIVMLSAFDDPNLVIAAFMAGAVGYLLK